MLIDKIPVTGRKLILSFLDAVVIVFALGAATWMHYPELSLREQFETYTGLLPFVICGKLIVFYVSRLYSFLWRYASVNEIMVVARASLYSALVFAAAAHFFYLSVFSARLLMLDAVLTFVGIGGLRLLLRGVREYLAVRPKSGEDTQTTALVVGAGDAGELVLRELRKQQVPVVGFVDDKPSKLGIRIHNTPVLGTTYQISEIAKKHGVGMVIIAIPSASGQTIRRIIEDCQKAKLRFKITPNILDIVLKKTPVASVREVRIEDLLGRETVAQDIMSSGNYVQNKVVLITGAGGSIGSELCRQIAMFSPEKIIVLDHAETAVFQIEQDLISAYPSVPVFPIVADVRRESVLERIFEAHSPDIVFHAAAYKHVPLMEANPHVAFYNNIIGTNGIMKLSKKYKIKRFVLISTDKAVRPANCMGASKRVCELLMQYYAKQTDNTTCFTAVRFGNVLGSQGSVIPIFKQQIAAGGPVTVTHPDITRYFMTIPEAVSLVIQAGAMSRGGEIFILDMGDPVKITQLARDLIVLSGFVPDQEIPIVFSGLRPGEKLYEELSFDPTLLQRTTHSQIFVTRDMPKDLDMTISEVLALNPDAMSNAVLRQWLLAIANQSQPSVS